MKRTMLLAALLCVMAATAFDGGPVHSQAQPKQPAST